MNVTIGRSVTHTHTQNLHSRLKMKKILQIGLRLVAQFYYLITPKAKTKVFNKKNFHPSIGHTDNSMYFFLGETLISISKVNSRSISKIALFSVFRTHPMLHRGDGGGEWQQHRPVLYCPLWSESVLRLLYAH